MNTLREAAEALDEAHRAYERASSDEAYASREATIALNKLNEAQKAFDEVVSKIKQERGPNSSDWGRSRRECRGGPEACPRCRQTQQLLDAVMAHVDPATHPGLTASQRVDLAGYAKPVTLRGDQWAVWPDGTECSLDEKRDLEELLTWKSDDYEVREAIGYDGTGCPIFVETSRRFC